MPVEAVEDAVADEGDIMNPPRTTVLSMKSPPTMSKDCESMDTLTEKSPEPVVGMPVTPPTTVALSSSFPSEDGSLMLLYESRLRRLRDYESKVFSRYSVNRGELSLKTDDQGWNVSETVEASHLPNEWYSNQHQRNSTTPLPCESTESSGMPMMMMIEIDEADEQTFDDITLSTGFASNSAPEGARVRDVASLKSPEAPSESEDPVADSKGLQSDEGGDVASATINSLPGGWGNLTFYSSESSEQSDWKKSREDKDKDPAELANNGGEEPYSYLAASDSKYEAYSVLVDPDQDDRAVEIALYTAARPHMRGFHFAWMSFFVAFFTWFAMTPLLSEIANSLDLNRAQIWTSSILAVAGSAFTRVMIGPVNDIYGARWTMAGTLICAAIPTLISGAVIHGATSLYITRLFIGIAGSSFVTCQFWTSSLFTVEVAGTGNSLAAGWGNLGGGVAQLVMGSLLFPLFKLIYGGGGGKAPSVYSKDENRGNTFDRVSNLAWRTCLVVPGLFCLYFAYACIRYSDDCPKGNFRRLKAQGLLKPTSAFATMTKGACNINTWILFLQYGCCFGVEITMTNAAALYFKEQFGQTTESAAAIASIFGWMNLFARGIGGFCSDMSSATQGMRGRLWVQVVTLIAAGGLVCVFSISQTLPTAIVVMAMFSIFVQAAEGSTFGIVPYVDHLVTGSISGIVGAGGNVGGVIFSLLFREYDNQTAFLIMGSLVLTSSLLTAFIQIPGHRSLLCGADAPEVLERRNVHTGQLGSLPNLDLHAHNSEAHRNRQTALRDDLQSPADLAPTHATDNPTAASEAA